MQLLKPVDQTSLDPNYLKVYRAYENVMFTDMGNNATFDGAGSIIGQASLSITPSEILTKNKVYKYSANGLNGQNDYVGFTVPLFSAFKNNTRSFQFKIKTVNANDADISSNVKIVGGTKDGYVYKKLLNTAGNTSIISQSFDVPSDATSLVIGFQNHSTSTTIQFFIDDISLGYKAFDSLNVASQESISYHSYSSKDGSNFVLFSTKDLETSFYSSILSVTSTTQTRFTILKKCNVQVSASLGVPSYSSRYGEIQHYRQNGTLRRTAVVSGQTSFGGESIPYVGFADVGDYFLLSTGSTLNADNSANFSITAQAIADNIIQQSVTTDRIGETIYLLKNVAPSGFIPAMGSSIGKTTGTFQGDAYKALYDLLWTVSTLTAGDPYLISSAKGASSQVDWDLNKTITIDESGLFTRAFKTGVSGAVGAKQSDDFLSHNHTIPVASGGASAIGRVQYSDTANSYNGGPTGSTGGSETRPVNVAKYVFIRYANLVPNIYSLPNAAQQDYTIECRGNSGQVVNTGTNIPWTLLSQNNLTWNGSSFTAPIAGTYHISGNLYSNSSQHQLGFYVNGVLSKTVSLQNSASVQDFFSQDIYLLENQTFSIRDLSYAWTLNASLPAYHTLKITRLNGKNDSVFAGEVARNLEAIIQYRGNGSRTTLSTTPVAMPLTVIKGDSQIVSIASNQFTLQAGEYEIDWSILFQFIATASIGLSYIYNITDSIEIERSEPVYLSSGSYSFGRGITKISITSQKVFELRVAISNAGNWTLGDTVAFPNDLNGFIKITKLLGL